jgi:SAM-dependent methyltransferase
MDGNVQKYLKLQRTKNTYKSLFDPVAHVDTEVTLEMEKYIVNLKVENILELGCGVGESSVYFFNKFDNLKESTFYLLDGDSGNKSIYYINYDSDKDFYNSMSATKEFCETHNLRNHVLINYEKEDIPEVKFDLVYSTFSIGFHWPVSLYLEKIKNNLNEGALLLFHIRGKNNKKKDDFKKWNIRQKKYVKRLGNYSIIDFKVSKYWGLLVLKYVCQKGEKK